MGNQVYHPTKRRRIERKKLSKAAMIFPMWVRREYRRFGTTLDTVPAKLVAVKAHLVQVGVVVEGPVLDLMLVGSVPVLNRSLPHCLVKAIVVVKKHFHSVAEVVFVGFVLKS